MGFRSKQWAAVSTTAGAMSVPEQSPTRDSEKRSPTAATAGKADVGWPLMICGSKASPALARIPRMAIRASAETKGLTRFSGMNSCIEDFIPTFPRYTGRRTFPGVLIAFLGTRCQAFSDSVGADSRSRRPAAPRPGGPCPGGRWSDRQRAHRGPGTGEAAVPSGSTSIHDGGVPRDSLEDAPEQLPGHRDLGHLEHEVAPMGDDLGAQRRQ